jgi:TonB family protein
MSRKVKFHTFNVLFQLFAFLADKTGGWRVFVRPKLLLGSLIVGLGLTGCGTKTENISNQKTKESIRITDRNKRVSLKRKNDPFSKTTMCYVPIATKKEKFKKLIEPMVTCYDTGVIIHDTIEKVDDNSIYETVDQLPKFPGGDIELMNFLEKQIKYPSIESISNINGKVICGFIVDKDGSISDITIYRSLDPILDSIAVKAIKAMPKFIPGKQNGQAVRVRYTLPIIFRTQD